LRQRPPAVLFRCSAGSSAGSV